MAKPKDRRRSMSASSASKVSVPSHKSKWPELKVSMPPNSQPVKKPVKIVFKDESSDEELGGLGPLKKAGQGSNGPDGEDESSVSSTDTESKYDSAEEVPTKSTEKITTNTHESDKSKKAKAAASDDAHGDSSSSSESSSEDDISSDSDSDEAEPKLKTSTKQVKKQETPKLSRRRTSISSKEQLKNAVAEKHTENKKKGVKASVQGNVFNARSPAGTIGTPAKPKSADKPSKKSKDSESSKAPATAPVPRLRAERSDAPPPSSVPLLTAKESNPGKAVVRPSTGDIKGTPRLENQDNSGHRLFSSSMFSKQSSSEPEAEEQNPKAKKSKRSKATEACADPVLAEARKQAERLRQLKIKKKANGLETSPFTKPKAKLDDSEAEDDAQSDANELAAEASSVSGDIKGGGSKKSKKDDRKKRKDRQSIPPTKSSRKQKLDQSDNDDNDTTISTPKATKKSKKRKRDSKDQERESKIEECAKPSKKARKSVDTIEANGSLETTVEQDASGKKIKKSEETKEKGKKKQDKDSQGDEPVSSRKIPKHSSKRDHEREVSPHPAGPQDKSVKKNAAEERSIGSDNPDTAHLITHFRKLLPPSALESAMAKLNSDNKDMCSKRKLQHLQKYAKKKRNIPASDPVDYGLNDDVTVLTAARDMIVLLSGTRFETGVAGGVGGRSDALGPRAANMSVMELELGRIAMERQWENERLREQVGNLQARIQRLAE